MGIAMGIAVAGAVMAQFLLTGGRPRSTAALENVIGPGGYLWIDAGEQLVHGQDVGTWRDLIQGLDAVQTTEADKPMAILNQLTGRMEIQLDGTDYLQTAAFASALTQPTTIYAVVRDTVGADAALRTVVTGIHTDNKHSVLSDTIWKLTSGDPAISYATPAIDTVPHLVAAEFNDGSTKLFLDGSEVTGPHGNSGPDTLTGVTIGASAGGASLYDGNISAIVVKNALRETAIETELTNYLQLDDYLGNDVVDVIAAIGTDGYLWIDAGNGQLVDTQGAGIWTDLIQGMDAVQDTGSKQPVAQIDGTTGFLELVFVRGSNQSLQTTTFASDLTQPTTIYTVLELDYGESSKHLQRDIFDGIDSDKSFIFDTQSTVWKMRSGVSWISYSAFVEDVIQIMTTEYNQPASKLYIDGVDSGFSGNPGSNALSGLTMGGNYAQTAVFWDGQLSAIAIKPGLRDSAVEVALNDYLNLP